jgi:uracil-DNA glycosylase
MTFLPPAKLLGNRSEVRRREAFLLDPHVRPLTEYVQRVRAKASGRPVPGFDPEDGGVDARVLFLSESPGPGAVESGFISRDNPDETARNFLELAHEAGLDRKATVLWNVVPWFVGTGEEKAALFAGEAVAAAPLVEELLLVLPSVRVVVLVGGGARKFEKQIRRARRDVRVVNCPMPSPLWVNRSREANRRRILDVLLEVRRLAADRPT